MKRYVCASVFDDKSYEGVAKKLNHLKRDFKMLAKCVSFDDVQSVEWATWNITNFIKRDIQKGLSEEEAIDGLLDWMYNQINNTKQELEQAKEYEEKSSGLMNNLANGVGGLSSMYDVIQVTKEFILIQPWKDAKHKDCIQFVDQVVNLLNCSFSGTGRGGSWTQWNLVTDTGVRLSAGWSSSFDVNQFNIPENTWIVKLD